MTTQSNPGHTFLNETLRVMLFQNYLLKTELHCRKTPGDIADVDKRLRENLRPDYESTHDFAMARLFIGYIGSFELFLQDCIQIVVLKHPKKLGGAVFKLSEILDSENTDSLVSRAIEEYLNKMMYKKPFEFLDDMSSLISIDKEPLVEKWKIFIEAKARRDLGAHNNWKCNATYLRKITEAGLTTLAKTGDVLLPTDQEYLEVVSNALLDLSESITIQIQHKHSLFLEN